jgi:hypothetical protein
MKYIKLFEWFLKTRSPEEIIQWNKPMNNPLKDGRFKDIKINDKRLTGRDRDGVKMMSRELYEFPNDPELLNDVKYAKNISNKDLTTLLEFGISHMPNRTVDLGDYNVLLIPETGSNIVFKLMETLFDVIPGYGQGGNKKEWRPQIYQNAFKKRKWKDVEWNMDLINRTSEATRNDVLKLIEKLKTKKGEEYAKLSDNVIPRYRKFIKTFMDIRPAVEADLSGKNVMILDDFVTDGTTRKQMRNLVLPYKPRSILNLALFYIRGQKQESDSDL